MKERPILFSTPMVRAILEGRKGQTRRIVKHPIRQYQNSLQKCLSFHIDGGGNWVGWSSNRASLPKETKVIYSNGEGIKCPYGQPGDILWVRETWAFLEGPPSEQDNTTDWGFCYKADDPHIADKWKPSIFMPKEACRIRLEVTDVRVERLNDITDDDAKAEGVYFYGWDDYHQDDYKNYLYDDKNYDDWGVQTAKESYETLWESINSKGSWKKNPWVWVITFKRIQP